MGQTLYDTARCRVMPVGDSEEEAARMIHGMTRQKVVRVPESVQCVQRNAASKLSASRSTVARRSLPVTPTNRTHGVLLASKT